MHQALQDVGVESKLVIFEGAGHGFPPEDEMKARDEMLDWFNRHLGASSNK